MASVLKINGATINRVTARVTLGSVRLSMDDFETLSFTELRVAGGPGSWSAGQSCELILDGTSVFVGQIVAARPSGAGQGAITVSYTAYGLRYLANQIFITASDGTGLMGWNLPSTDPDYLSTNSGKSVGQILKEVLDQHSAQLAAAGLSASPPYTAAELTALTTVPPEPIVLSGRLWDACADFLAQYCPKYAMWPSAADQKIHVQSTIGLAATTYTLDSDPVTLDSISKSHAECYTRVVLRGAADIQAAYLSLEEGTLEEGWTAPQEADWSINDFYMPRDAADAGDITAQTSTTVTVQSDSGSRFWATNFWNGVGATLWAYDPAATGLTFSEQRTITACTSLSAGGTSTLTVDRAFANTGYSRYQIRGTRTETSLVWRKYKIKPTWIAQHLARRFNHAVAWAPIDGAVTLTWLPTGNVCWSSFGGKPYMEFPAPFELVLYDGSTDGYLIFYEPVVKAFNSRQDLEAGGASVQPPADIKVLVPYSRGTLTATKPASGYEGTAYTVDGVQRTLYLDYPEWRDAGNATAMADLAQQKLDSVKDTVIDGTLTYWGKAASWLTLGKSLNIARSGGTTGWESLAAPVRSVSLEYQASTSIWVTRLSFSTRRRPFTGDRLFTKPNYGAMGGFAGSMLDTQLAASGAMADLTPFPGLAAFGSDFGGGGGGDFELDLNFGRTGERRVKKPFVGPPNPSEIGQAESFEQFSDRRQTEAAQAAEKQREIAKANSFESFADKRREDEERRQREKSYSIPDGMLDAHLEKLARGDYWQ